MFRTRLLLALLLASPSLWALPEDWQQEMIIQSDRAELDRKTGMVVYEGDVQLTQGTLQIRSDRLLLMLDGKSLQQAVAEGNPAHYQQQVRSDSPVTKAKAERIDFFAEERRITFSGNAELRQENNVFSGERIRYNIEQETVSANAGDANQQTKDAADGKNPERQRIRVVIQPQNSEQTPKEAGTAEPETTESADAGTDTPDQESSQ